MGQKTIASFFAKMATIPRKPLDSQQPTPSDVPQKRKDLEIDVEINQEKTQATDASVVSPARPHVSPKKPLDQPVEMDVDTADTKTSAKNPSKKFNYYEYKAKRAKLEHEGPKASGSKEIPIGTDGCLENLTFVFTGELSSISREGAQDLVRKYGGRVTGSVSKKTTYVVVGEEPGESKLKKAKECKVDTLDEDGLFDLIRRLAKTPSMSEVDGKSTAASPVKPSAPVTLTCSSTVDAPMMAPAVGNVAHAIHKKILDMAGETELWTDKYKPKVYADIVGNKGNVEKLALWLTHWGTHSGGLKDEIMEKKAVLISGPPGIGKTTAAHLVCANEGWEAIEFNASDTRSKKSIDMIVRDLTTSHTVTHFFGHQKPRARQLLIMDEVDGMSSGDRGGIGQLISLIKQTRIPIICICNDRQSPKIRSLANHCYDMRFRRATPDQVENRVRMIAQKEGIELKPNAVRNLVESTQGDIRQILNLLSTFSLSQKTLSYDLAKQLGKESEKNIAKGPWDVLRDLFSVQTFRHASFNDKMDFYFNDYQLIPLMVHENYPRVTPALPKDMGLSGKHMDLEVLHCLSQAAESIADADLFETAIRTNNDWSLLPAHAVFSTIRPAFFMHGFQGGQIMFPTWLGNFSKQNKYYRLLKELFVSMRLRISGNKNDVRQNYVPTLAQLFANNFAKYGKTAIPDVIQMMDDYYITKDDLEVMLELGIGSNLQSKLFAKFSGPVKSEFTRMYNKLEHPVPFICTTQAKATKLASAPKPDFDDILDDDVIDEEDDEEDEEDDPIAKDKLIKKPKQPSSSKGASSTKSKSKK